MPINAKLAEPFDKIRHNIQGAAHILTAARGVGLLLAITLAFGIGANTAMLGIVDELVFRYPDHVTEPDRLVRVTSAVNYVDYNRLRSYRKTLDVAGYTRSPFDLGLGEHAIPIQVECVTPSYFSVIGVRPHLGRLLQESDGIAGEQKLVVLEYGLWQRQFGGDPLAIEQTVSLSGRRYEIVGVAPRGFAGIQTVPVNAWVLLEGSPEACSFTGTNLLSSTNGAWLRTIGRIGDGLTLPQADAALAGAEPVPLVSDRKDLEAPGQATRTQMLEPLYDRRPTSRLGRVSVWLGVGSSLIFLTACLNVAGLLSVRVIERRREMAVRLQLGATRGRIALQLITESLVLSFVSGLGAWIVALSLRGLVGGFFSIRQTNYAFDPRLLFLAVGSTVFAGLLCGGLSAIQVARFDGGRALRSGPNSLSEGATLRSALLIAQVASAFVLVVCAGLFVRSLANLTDEPGYDIDRVIVATVDLQKAGYQVDEQKDIFNRLRSGVQELPGVVSASLGSRPILNSETLGFVTGVRSASRVPGATAMFVAVSESYFETVGTRILKGRSFGPLDVASQVAVIDEQLAAKLWPDSDPIGQCVIVGGPEGGCTTVLGIIASRRHSSLDREGHEIFVPFARTVLGELATIPRALFVRTSAGLEGQGDMSARVAATIRGTVDNLPFVDVRPLSDFVDRQTVSWRLSVTVLGIFGILATALSGVGIYGALGLSVRQRTPELGVHIAIGGTRWNVLCLVIRRWVVVVLIGIAVGVPVSIGVTGLLGNLLYEVASTDTATFLSAGVIIAVIALAGLVAPAARAIYLDPVAALRGD